MNNEEKTSEETKEEIIISKIDSLNTQVKVVGFVVGFLVVAILLVYSIFFVQPEVKDQAAVVSEINQSVSNLESTLDTDGDGFMDNIEATGFTLSQDNIFFPACTPTPVDRSACVDWNTPDLFVVVERLDSSFMPASIDPFEFVTRPKAENGLGITVHELTPGQLWGNRQVTPQSAQVAASIIETTKTDFDNSCQPQPPDKPFKDIFAGMTFPGAGYLSSDMHSEIYPLNAVAKIDYWCNHPDHANEILGCINLEPLIEGNRKECDLSGGLNPGELDDLDFYFIKYTIAHEIAHNLHLAEDPRNFPHHRVFGARLMEEYIEKPDWNKKTLKYEWEIPTFICGACVSGYEFYQSN